MTSLIVGGPELTTEVLWHLRDWSSAGPRARPLTAVQSMHLNRHLLRRAGTHKGRSIEKFVQFRVAFAALFANRCGSESFAFASAPLWCNKITAIQKGAHLAPTSGIAAFLSDIVFVIWAPAQYNSARFFKA